MTMMSSCMLVITVSGNYSLVPSPMPSFSLVAVRNAGEPGTFPHVSDIKGRKTVERPKMNVGVLGLRTARRAKVPGTSIPS